MRTALLQLAGEGLVERNGGLPEAPDAGLVTEGLLEHLAERDGDVLDRDVLVLQGADDLGQGGEAVGLVTASVGCGVRAMMGTSGSRTGRSRPAITVAGLHLLHSAENWQPPGPGTWPNVGQH